MRYFIAKLSHDYPNIKIEFLNLEERLPEVALRESQFDLVCGFAHEIESFESISNQVWFYDHYVCLHHQEHPYQSELSLEKFLSYCHVVVTPWNEAKGILDITLSKLRKKRKLATYKQCEIGCNSSTSMSSPSHLQVCRHWSNRI